MAKRYAQSKRKGRRSFAKKSIPHKKNRMNNNSMVFRGGYRL